MPIRTNRGRAAVYRRIWGAPLRSPRHLLATVVVLVVLATGIGFLIPRLVAGGEPAGSGTSVAPGGTSAATTSSGQGTPESGGDEPGDQAATQTRLPDTPITPEPAPPAEAAVRAARAFAEAWVDHSEGTTSKQWLAGLEPLTTEEFLPQLETVDVRNLPASKVTGEPEVVSSTKSSVEADVPTDGPVLRVTVIKTSDGWRTDAYTEGD